MNKTCTLVVHCSNTKILNKLHLQVKKKNKNKQTNKQKKKASYIKNRTWINKKKKDKWKKKSVNELMNKQINQIDK